MELNDIEVTVITPDGNELAHHVQPRTLPDGGLESNNADDLVGLSTMVDLRNFPFDQTGTYRFIIRTNGESEEEQLIVTTVTDEGQVNA